MDWATDLPAPGSPPMSTLRSTSETVTGSPSSSSPTGIGSHAESCRASRLGQGHGSAVASGSR